MRLSTLWPITCILAASAAQAESYLPQDGGGPLYDGAHADIPIIDSGSSDISVSPCACNSDCTQFPQQPYCVQGYCSQSGPGTPCDAGFHAEGDPYVGMQCDNEHICQILGEDVHCVGGICQYASDVVCGQDKDCSFLGPNAVCDNKACKESSGDDGGCSMASASTNLSTLFSLLLLGLLVSLRRRSAARRSRRD